MTEPQDEGADSLPTLRVLGLTKTFGDNVVLDGVSLSVSKEGRSVSSALADPANRRF
jgi:hypothetical protein